MEATKDHGQEKEHDDDVDKESSHGLDLDRFFSPCTQWIRFAITTHMSHDRKERDLCCGACVG